MLINTPSSLLLQLQRLPLFNSWLLIQVALLENISEITESTPWSSMTIFQNKPSLIDKCHSCWEDLPVERLTQVMCFISILDFWKEQPRWTKSTVVVPLLPSPSLKLKLVMCLLIFQLMSSQLLMDKSFWKLNSSIKVLDQQLMSVFLSPESDLPLKLRPWSKSPVLLN